MRPLPEPDTLLSNQWRYTFEMDKSKIYLGKVSTVARPAEYPVATTK
jgi:hypothetical protein